ncbi:MAG: class I SAM-dependent methyltransferase [Gemmatimonadota bacterium]|nr:class I SAM-dependent methyltransferase [Gemmatimonadota bacterium]
MASVESGIPPCSLCGAGESVGLAATDDERRYFECSRCGLVYLDPSQHLTVRAERERYELHENDSADAEYVRFLRRLADPVIERLPLGARGLDFGCGPAPVLAEQLTSAGFPCAAYDPFFAPDETLLATRYDYVTASEVVEHARSPATMFATLRELLVPGGLLGVMTRFRPGDGSFGDWWYRRDPTHVCFYTPATMRWIEHRHAWRADFPAPDITIFTMSL